MFTTSGETSTKRQGKYCECVEVVLVGLTSNFVRYTNNAFQFDKVKP